VARLAVNRLDVRHVGRFSEPTLASESGVFASMDQAQTVDRNPGGAVTANALSGEREHCVAAASGAPIESARPEA